MSFTEMMDYVSRGFEVVGVAVLVVGFLSGLFRSLHAYFRAGERLPTGSCAATSGAASFWASRSSSPPT